MRAVLWDLLLLLLCLLARARGDCRGDCLHCDRQLYRDSFDVLVSAPAAPSSPGGIGVPDEGIWVPTGRCHPLSPSPLRGHRGGPEGGRRSRIGAVPNTPSFHPSLLLARPDPILPRSLRNPARSPQNPARSPGGVG